MGSTLCGLSFRKWGEFSCAHLCPFVLQIPNSLTRNVEKMGGKLYFLKLFTADLDRIIRGPVQGATRVLETAATAWHQEAILHTGGRIT